MTLRRIGLSFLVLSLICIASITASAQWRHLGSREVNDRVDHDTINVTAARGDFRKVRLSVNNAPVRMYRMSITYGNGETQEIQLRSLIKAGGQSRVIDLEGRERVIRKVDFWYEAASLGRRKARITLWGRD
jgi:hypothetical protein